MIIEQLAAARAAKVAYVPGRPFCAGARQLRLAYSRVADDLISEGVRRLADLTRAALSGNSVEES